MPDRDEQKIADFKKQYEETHEGWDDFYTFRQNWQQLIDRRAPVKLDDVLAKYGQGIDVESPMLEEDSSMHCQILGLDWPKLDAVSLDSSKDAKKDVEDVRIVLSSQMLELNPGGDLSAGMSQSVVEKGVAVVDLSWHINEEPEDDEYEKRLKDHKKDDEEDDEAYDKRYLKDKAKARNDYFAEKGASCFDAENVNPIEMCWSPLKDHNLAFRRQVISYSEVKKLKRSPTLGGGAPILNKMGKVVWLGESRPNSEDDAYSESTEKPEFELITRSARDPETGDWKCTELLCLKDGDWKTDGDILNEYDIPLGRSRYFIIPSGDEKPLATDPHLRYRPKMYSELVLVGEENYLATVLTAMARMQLTDKMLYMDASKMTSETLQGLEAAGFITEGVGGLRKMAVKLTDIAAGEMGLMPGEVLSFPFPVSEHLMVRLQQIEAKINQVRPNRFLTGQAFSNADEPAPNTATQQLDSRQAAKLPYDAYLKKFDRFWEDLMWAIDHAMIFWDEDVEPGTQKPYIVVTTGEEPLLTGSVDPATSVTVTAEKLKRRKKLIVKTTNQTAAERVQSNLAADDAHLSKHATTRLQWLKERGFEDPGKQEEELEKERLEEMAKQEFAPIEQMMIRTYAGALMNLNLNAILPPPAMQPGQPQQTQEAPTNLIQAGPAITPAPVEGASGGSAPGGVM